MSCSFHFTVHGCHLNWRAHMLHLLLIGREHKLNVLVVINIYST